MKRERDVVRKQVLLYPYVGHMMMLAWGTMPNTPVPPLQSGNRTCLSHPGGCRRLQEASGQGSKGGGEWTRLVGRPFG